MNSIGILQGRLTPSNGRGIQFFPTENWQEEFELANQIGFNCIELLVRKENATDNPLFSDIGLTEIKKLKLQFAIATPSVHGFYSKDRNYPSLLNALIENSAKVDAKTILVSFFNDNALRNEDDKKLAYEQLSSTIKTAEKLGLKIAIEAEMFAPELKEFVDSFNSGAVGVYYDIGNMVSLNADIKKEVQLLGKLIFGVHIKDRSRNGGETVPIGSGDTDFRTVLQTLKDIRYNGPYILQGARKEGMDDFTLNKSYFEYIKKVLLDIK